MSNLKVSIITPSYNQAEFLEQTIDSVLSQNYPSLEYIVIDGGSEDNSKDILKKYEKHLTFWTSEKDMGQSDAINKGFKFVTGDIFNWINSDDYYLPDTFNKINNAFQDPKIDAVLGKSIIFDREGNTRITRGSFVEYSNLSKTIGQAQIDQPATFFRTSAIRDFFPLNQNLHYLMDRELWIKFLLRRKLNGIKKLNIPFVNFRIHDKSKSGSQSDLFNQEREGIYLSIVQKIGLDKITNLIRTTYPHIEDYDFQFELNNGSTEVLVYAINYYLLLLMEEDYNAGLHKQARFISKLIEREKLDSNEIYFLKKLTLKNNIKSILD